jgi:hypothetical protein
MDVNALDSGTLPRQTICHPIAWLSCRYLCKFLHYCERFCPAPSVIDCFLTHRLSTGCGSVLPADGQPSPASKAHSQPRMLRSLIRRTMPARHNRQRVFQLIKSPHDVEKSTEEAELLNEIATQNDFKIPPVPSTLHHLTLVSILAAFLLATNTLWAVRYYVGASTPRCGSFTEPAKHCKINLLPTSKYSKTYSLVVRSTIYDCRDPVRAQYRVWRWRLG